MSGYALQPELGLLSDESDRRFRRLVLVLAIPALIAGAWIPFVKIKSLFEEKLAQPQRYAKLIQQKPEEPKPVEEKKPEPKKPDLTPEQKRDLARKKAEKQLASLRDQLSELRDADLPKVNAPLAANVITSSSNPSFKAAASQGSGGIGEVGVVEHAGSATGLGSRRTTGVRSGIGGKGEGQGGKIVKGRTLEEIQLVFDRTKGAFYTMYVREQRQRPDMAGKVTVRLTIAPDGSVKSCRVVGSELNHPEFEKKVVARVLLMDFGAKDVGDFTIDYPILFFPS